MARVAETLESDHLEVKSAIHIHTLAHRCVYSVIDATAPIQIS